MCVACGGAGCVKDEDDFGWYSVEDGFVKTVEDDCGAVTCVAGVVAFEWYVGFEFW